MRERIRREKRCVWRERSAFGNVVVMSGRPTVVGKIPGRFSASRAIRAGDEARRTAIGHVYKSDGVVANGQTGLIQGEHGPVLSAPKFDGSGHRRDVAGGQNLAAVIDLSDPQVQSMPVRPPLRESAVRGAPHEWQTLGGSPQQQKIMRYSRHHGPVVNEHGPTGAVVLDECAEQWWKLIGTGG